MEPRYPTHFNPDSERFHYRKIASEGIDDKDRLTAEKAMEFFALDLEISSPSIQWIMSERWEVAEREEREAHRRSEETNQPYQCDCFHEEILILGSTPFDFDNEILILGDRDSGGLIQTIAHEMRHVWQEKTHGRLWRQKNADAAEKDAHEYADVAVNRYPEYVELAERSNEDWAGFQWDVAELEKLPEDRQEQFIREPEDGKEHWSMGIYKRAAKIPTRTGKPWHGVAINWILAGKRG